jgi:hypothetical protein
MLDVLLGIHQALNSVLDMDASVLVRCFSAYLQPNTWINQDHFPIRNPQRPFDVIIDYAADNTMELSLS